MKRKQKQPGWSYLTGLYRHEEARDASVHLENIIRSGQFARTDVEIVAVKRGLYIACRDAARAIRSSVKYQREQARTLKGAPKIQGRCWA